MADAKITDLTELPLASDDDILVIVDVDAAPATTKKITAENLVKKDTDVAANTVHRDLTTNPHTVTKAQVGLPEADNTSDIDKPVSTAQATAIGNVGTSLTNHENDLANPHQVTKTQVGLGSADDTADADKPVSTATAQAISDAISGLIDGAPVTLDTLNELAAAINDDDNFATTVTTQLANHTGNLANPHAVTKTQVGLGNAENTADADKPVSTAQAAADAVVQGNLTTHVNDVTNPHAVTKTQVGLSNLINESNQKGYLQYTNAGNESANEGAAYQTISLATDRESFPNGLFTKVNTDDFRTDFDGHVNIDYALLIDNDKNDQGVDVRVLKNSVEIVQSVNDGVTTGKENTNRDGLVTKHFKTTCADGDIFQLQFRSSGDADLDMVAGNGLFTIDVYRITP